MLNGTMASADYIDPKYIHRIVDEHINKRINYRLLIWSFMNFEWWCRLFPMNKKISE